MEDQHKKAYVIAVDMGYGHQRAVFPLLDMATTPSTWKIGDQKIISANDYPDIPGSDRMRWYFTQKLYETVSKIQSFRRAGKRFLGLVGSIQKIDSFYPRRDLSRPTYILNVLYEMIHNGFGKHFIESLNSEPCPFVCSHPIPAFCAEVHGFKGEIYCLCTDADIARAWAPQVPSESRIIYLAPTARVRERLKLYGVRTENIVVTGFPLPREAVGEHGARDVMMKSLSRRLTKLDPKGVYHEKFEKLISIYLGPALENTGGDKPLSITFAIGGAGAQSEIALSILDSFQDHIKAGRITLNLAAGTSIAIFEKFEREVHRLSLQSYRDNGIHILFHPEKSEYFRQFNALLVETDILWTKPSELSFYAGLGLPIVMSPTLGSQEEYNKAWLHMMGAGFEQYDPRYAHEWIFDWIDSGWLAQAAMNGFLNASKHGAEHIEDLVLRGKRVEIEEIHFV